MNRQYARYTYLGNIAKFASNVVMVSGMNENAALAKLWCPIFIRVSRRLMKTIMMKLW